MLCYGSRSYHSKTIEKLRWRLLYIHQCCRPTKPGQKRCNFQCGLHCFRRFSRRVCNPHDITDCRKLLQNWFVFGLQQMLAHIKLNNRFDWSLMQQSQQMKERGRTSFSKLKRNCQNVLVDLAQSDPFDDAFPIPINISCPATSFALVKKKELCNRKWNRISIPLTIAYGQDGSSPYMIPISNAYDGTVRLR